LRQKKKKDTLVRGPSRHEQSGGPKKESFGPGGACRSLLFDQGKTSRWRCRRKKTERQRPKKGAGVRVTRKSPRESPLDIGKSNTRGQREKVGGGEKKTARTSRQKNRDCLSQRGLERLARKGLSREEGKVARPRGEKYQVPIHKRKTRRKPKKPQNKEREACDPEKNGNAPRRPTPKTRKKRSEKKRDREGKGASLGVGGMQRLAGVKLSYVQSAKLVPRRWR